MFGVLNFSGLDLHDARDHIWDEKFSHIAIYKKESGCHIKYDDDKAESIFPLVLNSFGRTLPLVLYYLAAFAR